MKRTALALAVILALLISTLFWVQPAKPSSLKIVVPDDYATIQAAVENAGEGCMVFVKEGIYHENLKINKSLTLIGENRDTTVIDGNSSEGYRIPIRISHQGVSVTGFSLLGGWAGVQAGGESNISGNRIKNAQYGIMLSSNGSEITNNIIESMAVCGIQLTQAAHNKVQNNLVVSASRGIEIADQLLQPTSVILSENNTISENIIVDSKEYAIRLQFTKDNILVGNNITNSAGGISLFETDNNVLHHNNFINNTRQVVAGKEPMWTGGNEIRYSVCVWDNGSEGNYWSDYTGKDENGDGVGDTPYVINEKNTDNFPLMKPTIIVPNSPEDGNSTATDTQPFPITLVLVASGASLAAVSVGLLVYFKKRHSKAWNVCSLLLSKNLHSI
jgi:parallel beta-helix repeat protein